MSVNEKVQLKLPLDYESIDVAWDKGKPKWVLETEEKRFYVRKLTEWCNFYEVNYQMLTRKLRGMENQEVRYYKDMKVVKVG